MESEYEIFISPTALEIIKKQLSKEENSNHYLRVGVAGGKCSGYTYNIIFDNSILKNKDLSFNIDGINVIIDNKSILYLNRSTLDWDNTLMHQGFKIINSNVISECGCGKSVQFGNIK